MVSMASSITVKRFVMKDGIEMLETSSGDRSYANAVVEINGGKSYVVEDKDQDGKKRERALSTSQDGRLVFAENGQDIRQGGFFGNLTPEEIEEAKKEHEKETKKQAEIASNLRK